MYEAGFQRNTGGLQFSAERADWGGEDTVGGCEISAKGWDSRVNGMLSLILYVLFSVVNVHDFMAGR